jgi:hypothetical protein
VRFKLGCSLAYEVKAPTTFIFNVEVAKLQSLDIEDEGGAFCRKRAEIRSAPLSGCLFFALQQKHGQRAHALRPVD